VDVEQFSNPKWNERTPHLRRRILRMVLLDLLILALLLPIGEGLVRVLAPETARLLYSTELTGGYPIERNSLGLRDREFPTTRPASELRLICLGDSTTFGTGVAGEHTYPKQLEQLLNARGTNPSYLVINGGGQGNTVQRAIRFVESTGLELDPSVVILGFAPSVIGATVRQESAAVASAGERRGQQRPSLLQRASNWMRRAALSVHVQLHRTYLYTFIDANIRKRLYQLGILQDRMDKRSGAVFAYAFDVPGVPLEEIETSYSVYAECLAQLEEILDERGVPFIVMGIPSRFNLSDRGWDNERGFDLTKTRIVPLDRVARYCAELGIPFVDLRPRLRREREAMLSGDKPFDALYTPMDYTHLNSTGLRIAAEEILKCIDDHGWLDTPNEAR
jgi:lysophospholipase L1-like esterase